MQSLITPVTHPYTSLWEWVGDYTVYMNSIVSFSLLTVAYCRFLNIIYIYSSRIERLSDGILI